MAAHPITAVIDFYDTLPGAQFPGGTRYPLYLNEAPATDSAGAQVRPPYCTLEDGGRSREVMSDNGGPESGEFSITVHAASVGDIAAAMLAIRFAGQDPKDRAGLDGGTLVLDAPYEPVSVVMLTDTISYSGLGQTGGRVHQGEMRFFLVAQIIAG